MAFSRRSVVVLVMAISPYACFWHGKGSSGSTTAPASPSPAVAEAQSPAPSHASVTEPAAEAPAREEAPAGKLPVTVSYDEFELRSVDIAVE